MPAPVGVPRGLLGDSPPSSRHQRRRRSPVLAPPTEFGFLRLGCSPSMSAKYGGRKDSFAVLPLDVSGDNWSFSNRSMSNRTIGEGEENGITAVRRRKSKSSKRKKKKIMDSAEIAAAWSLTSGIDDDENLEQKNGRFLGVLESSDVLERSMIENAIERSEVEQDASESSRLTSTSFAELRQRSVNGGSVCNEIVEEEVGTRESSIGQWRPASHEDIPILSNQKSTDWKRLMAEYPGLLEGTFR